MNEATIALTVMTFLIFVVFLAFLIWGIRSGQFKNVEEAAVIPFKSDGCEDPGTAEKAAPEAPAGPGQDTEGDR